MVRGHCAQKPTSIITVYGIVSGVTGGGLPISILLILGLATVFADAISMSVSDYMSQLAEKDMAITKEKEMLNEVEKAAEVRDAFIKHLKSQDSNFTQDEIDTVMNILGRDRRFLVDFYLTHSDQDEKVEESAKESALATFISFVFFGLIPLTSTLLSSNFAGPFISATIWTLCTLFLLGWVKAQFTMQKPLVSGGQMALLGGISAFTAYLIAYWISTLEQSAKGTE